MPRVKEVNPIGIMQGRLSPPIEGRIQAFPSYSWKSEFAVARSCGLDLIEWIFEGDDWVENPLFACPGQIQRLTEQYGVRVLSVCADFFMDNPLIRASKAEQEARTDVLLQLILQCGRIGIRYIVVPFVDSSAVKTDEEVGQVVNCLGKCLPIAERAGVKLAVESSLIPVTLADLMRQLNHPYARINYDIGNSASLGYSSHEEVAAYGAWIETVHVKDRIRGGPTVPLGTGDADFDVTFSALAAIGYRGPFVLQAARGTIGEEVNLAKGYREFVSRYVDKYHQKGPDGSRSKG